MKAVRHNSPQWFIPSIRTCDRRKANICMDGIYKLIKTRNCSLHHNRLLFSVYFCRFVWWILLFTHATYFLVFQYNSTMISTTHNDVINVKPYWECFVWITLICLLVMNIDTYPFITTNYYTFLVWQCIIRLSICTHFILFHIRCFGINVTSIWHNCVSICFKYAIWFFTRPSVLIIETLIFQFFKCLLHKDINDECIIL